MTLQLAFGEAICFFLFEPVQVKSVSGTMSIGFHRPGANGGAGGRGPSVLQIDRSITHPAVAVFVEPEGRLPPPVAGKYYRRKKDIIIYYINMLLYFIQSINIL
jgi:hypothetical protein